MDHGDCHPVFKRLVTKGCRCPLGVFDNQRWSLNAEDDGKPARLLTAWAAVPQVLAAQAQEQRIDRLGTGDALLLDGVVRHHCNVLGRDSWGPVVSSSLILLTGAGLGTLLVWLAVRLIHIYKSKLMGTRPAAVHVIIGLALMLRLVLDAMRWYVLLTVDLEVQTDTWKEALLPLTFTAYQLAGAAAMISLSRHWHLQGLVLIDPSASWGDFDNSDHKACDWRWPRTVYPVIVLMVLDILAGILAATLAPRRRVALGVCRIAGCISSIVASVSCVRTGWILYGFVGNATHANSDPFYWTLVFRPRLWVASDVVVALLTIADIVSCQFFAWPHLVVIELILLVEVFRWTMVLLAVGEPKRTHAERRLGSGLSLNDASYMGSGSGVAGAVELSTFEFNADFVAPRSIAGVQSEVIGPRQENSLSS